MNNKKGITALLNLTTNRYFFIFAFISLIFNQPTYADKYTPYWACHDSDGCTETCYDESCKYGFIDLHISLEHKGVKCSYREMVEPDYSEDNDK